MKSRGSAKCEACELKNGKEVESMCTSAKCKCVCVSNSGKVCKCVRGES